MAYCAGQLAGGSVCTLRRPTDPGDGVFTDEDIHIKYWFPVLTGFSEIVSHPHIDVRTVYVVPHTSMLWRQTNSIFSLSFVL